MFELEGNSLMLNKSISEKLRKKIYLFMCNSDLSDDREMKLMKLINKSFNEGRRKEELEEDSYYFNFPGFVEHDS